MNSLVYNLILFLSKLSIPLFFSDVFVIGRKNVPRNGAIMIVGNHPNMFVDVLIMATTCGRPLSVWAKATLFKGFVGWLARACGAVPVQRKMDSIEQPKDGHMDNSALNEITFRSFNEGRAMCLFPEGTSHSESHLLSLKDGAAWMKFQFYDSTDGTKDVPIIPCGITYLNKHRFRSPVVIQYGKPIYLNSERLESFRKDNKQEVKKFTKELEDCMYQVTLNSPDWETMKLAHAARRLYMADSALNLPEYVEVTRRFSDFYTKSKGDPQVEELRSDIAAYQEKLDGLHIRDSQVREKWTMSTAIWKLIDRLVFLLILLPLAIPGFVINGPIMILGKCMNYLTPHQEAKATLKIMSSFVATIAMHTIMSIVLAYYFNLSILLCLVVLPILGAFHIRILEEELTGYKGVVASLRIISVIVRNAQREELKKLKVIRAGLEKRVTEMVDKFATPEQRTLQIEGESLPKLGPKIIRRNSFSEQVL